MWWQILLVVVAAIVCYFTAYHLWLRQRQLRYKKQLDTQMKLLLPKIQKKIPQILPQTLQSTIPLSIWHRDVLVYEYQLQLANANPIKITASQLSVLLNEALHLPARLLVTECWQREQTFHFDVVYLNNPTTLEYVDDMEKIDADNHEHDVPEG
ncbi:hypothetical protein [Lapidilactobacillus bayanensis]|uniref:hypothetical protein n=1 Tax=Lapidilactobacillus bayanensis TaxID=2485998 RepID=UPI000F77ED61|nr:hypothetical protein [Lapidilactobacillus bayanensis]